MGQICHHFSWTFDYVLETVDWNIIQRMLIDAPSYDEPADEKKPEKKVFDFKEQSSEDLLNLFNTHFNAK